MDANQLWRVFNLSPAEVEAIHREQDGLCAVCGRPLKLGSPSVTIDHNHKTGLVQGLLCFLCNRAIGLLGDDPARLLAAIRYLANPTAPAALGAARFGRIGRTTRKVGKNKRKEFRPRGESWAGYSPTAEYVCGCKDYGARPLKECPVHKQPEQRAAQAGGRATSGDALLNRDNLQESTK